MTDQEKLQKLFDAALRDSTPVEKAPTRAVPKTSTAQKPAAIMCDAPVPQAAPAAMDDERAVIPQPVLDKAAADELAVLLDDQMRRRKRRHRRESLVAALVLIAFTGGSATWFVQSPERVQALFSAIAEIRSVGDVKSMVAKYQVALDRISARGQQLDEKTKAMGITSNGKDDKDPYLDAEMKQMMGGEGKTTGDRAGNMQQAFGKTGEKHDAPAREVAADLGTEETFEWGR